MFTIEVREVKNLLDEYSYQSLCQQGMLLNTLTTKTRGSNLKVPARTGTEKKIYPEPKMLFPKLAPIIVKLVINLHQTRFLLFRNNLKTEDMNLYSNIFIVILNLYSNILTFSTID